MDDPSFETSDCPYDTMMETEQQAMQATSPTSSLHSEKPFDPATTMSLTVTLPDGPDIQRNYKQDGSLDLTQRWTKVMHHILSYSHSKPRLLVSITIWRKCTISDTVFTS